MDWGETRARGDYNRGSFLTGRGGGAAFVGSFHAISCCN